ncbi:hypothetical protein DPMN_016622, partial [Dreissena polymorpha]
MILGPSVFELSSDNHLVDGLTDRPTNRPTDHHEQSNIPPLLRRGAYKLGGVVDIWHGGWFGWIHFLRNPERRPPGGVPPENCPLILKEAEKCPPIKSVEICPLTIIQGADKCPPSPPTSSV